VNAGFTLTDPNDPRYQKVVAHRKRFGEVIQRASSLLSSKDKEGEDHIDAVIATTKAIDVYLLEYGFNRTTFETLQKSYVQARE
jgi:proteasome activator subunit 4